MKTMRNISFQLTTEQIRDRSKTETRRLGWKNLKVGQRLRACVKCMGLKSGEKIQPLAVIEVVSIHREPLNVINQRDCIAEGFPNLTPKQFIIMFCEHMGCLPNQEVTVIKFRYVSCLLCNAEEAPNIWHQPHYEPVAVCDTCKDGGAFDRWLDPFRRAKVSIQISGHLAKDRKELMDYEKHESRIEDGICPNGCARLNIKDDGSVYECPACGYIQINTKISMEN